MQTIPIIAAGVICVATAIVHGILTQRLFVKPLLATADVPVQIRTLFPMLMQFGTLAWLAGGLALTAAPFVFSPPVQMTVAVVVAGMYSICAVGNFVATRGRHPGWIALGLATGLIAFAVV